MISWAFFFARAGKGRRASILLLVVALVLILAMVGTALISTTRIDRYSSLQHQANVQVELLLDGVKNIAKGVVVIDLFSSGAYRPAVNAVNFATDSYEHFDALAQPTPLPAAGSNGVNVVRNDQWLGSRLPEFDGTNVEWPAITGPIAARAGEAFASPVQIGSGTILYSNQTQMQPAAVTVNGRVYPAWHIGSNYFVAADTDGDGIADAGLSLLPVGTIDGVTYYAAVRIIDNNSAINASTALAWNASGAALPGNFFPSNVNLQALLAGTAQQQTDQMSALSAFRYNGASASLDPIGDDNVGRSDFKFASESEALWMQLGRRLGNPGYNTASKKYRALTISESMALASRFCLANTIVGSSELERRLAPSLVTGVHTSPYAPGDVSTWFANNFYDVTASSLAAKPLRSLLVASNPVSNLTALKDAGGATSGSAYPIAPKAMTDSYPDSAYPAPSIAPKISINTATFAQLWRGFWSVMTESGLNAPFVTASGGDARMFRSVLRVALPQASSGTIPAALTDFDMVLLRSALAAVNAIDLRDGDDDVTSRTITLASSGLKAVVFGTERQPYITEVYVDNFAAARGTEFNPKGYVAIELHNPYPVAMTLNNWMLGVIDRRTNPSAGGTSGTNPPVYPLTIRPLSTHVPALVRSDGTPDNPGTLRNWATGGGPVVIPANGYVVLENLPPAFDAQGNIWAKTSVDAQYRPGYLTSATTGGTFGGFIYVPNLHEAIEDSSDLVETGGELVLLRPRRADGVPSVSTDPNNLFDEISDPTNPQYNPNYICDMVPVDSFDFTGMIEVGELSPKFTYWHYVRKSDDTGSGTGAWKFIYPGIYNSNHTQATNPVGSPNLLATQVATFSKDDPVPTFTTPATLGAASSAIDYVNNFPGIQLNNTDFAGPNKTYDQTKFPATPMAGPYTFPFGGFARNGDMLEIPFIGAYQIRQVPTTTPAPGTPPQIIEMNSVTIDATLATDGDSSDDAYENIGRFCPVRAAPGAGVTVNDYDPAGTYDDLDATKPVKWRYRWTRVLFDYFTVEAPHDDYLPDVDPAMPGTSISPTTMPAYPGASPPQPVANSDPAVANQTSTPPGRNENTAAVQGLVNINTASWIVLATLPMFTDGLDTIHYDQATGKIAPGGNGIDDNIDAAKAIVAWRDGVPASGAPGHGPFASVCDLNSIYDPATGLGFANGWGKVHITPGDTPEPGNADGDLSPLGGNDNVRGDFEEQFLMLNRISNLITTRSDSFTVYVVVQGWRNAGASNAQLVVQKRAAMIIDRSQITPQNKEVSVINIPAN